MLCAIGLKQGIYRLFDYEPTIDMLLTIPLRRPQGWRGVSASRRCHMHEQITELVESAKSFDARAGVGYCSVITPRRPPGLAGFSYFLGTSRG
jgi:hypothetical protein